MNEQTLHTIINWWVHFTDLNYLKQNAGDRQIDKLITLNRLTGEMLSENERNLFKTSLISIIKLQQNDFELSVDYNPEGILLKALNNCGKVANKIILMLHTRNNTRRLKMNQIKVTKLSYDYIQEIADSIECKGFSNEIRFKEAVEYLCERAAWLKENQDNLYTYREVDSKNKLIKVNLK